MGPPAETVRSLLRYHHTAASSASEHAPRWPSICTRLLLMACSKPGPRYTRPVYTCSRFAPARNFSSAAAAQSMPPTPMMASLAPQCLRMWRITAVDAGWSGTPLRSPSATAAGLRKFGRAYRQSDVVGLLSSGCAPVWCSHRC